jgi:hypothetical protein
MPPDMQTIDLFEDTCTFRLRLKSGHLCERRKLIAEPRSV